MQATFEIGAFIIITAGMLWWVYRGFSSDALLGEKLGMAGVKIFFWIIVIFFAISMISANHPLSVPVLPVLATYVGGLLSFGFVVAGSVVNRIRNLRIGQQERLAGIPTEPNLLSPWIPAVLTAFISVCVVAAVSIPWFLVLSQQQVLLGVESYLSSGASSPSFGVGPDTAMIIWVASAVLVVVLVASGFQWLRRRRAWRQYEELCIGIENRFGTGNEPA